MPKERTTLLVGSSGASDSLRSELVDGEFLLVGGE